MKIWKKILRLEYESKGMRQRDLEDLEDSIYKGWEAYRLRVFFLSFHVIISFVHQRVDRYSSIRTNRKLLNKNPEKYTLFHFGAHTNFNLLSNDKRR